MKLTTIIFAVAVALAGCATLKNSLRTVDDIADGACSLFGTEHPQEFKQLVKNVAPPGVSDQYDKSQLSVGDLCKMKEIVQPFIDDQLRLQQSTAAGLHAQMSGGGDAAPSK